MKKFLILLLVNLLSVGYAQTDSSSSFHFDSSDKELASSVNWAKNRALLYSYNGTDPVDNSNGANPREASVDCHFLEKGKSYTATLHVDADDAHYKTNPQAYRIEKQQISSETKLKIFTASGGGFGIKIIQN